MFLWGMQLGFGVTTVIQYSSQLALLAAMVLLPVQEAAAAGAAFGFAREFPTFLAFMRRSREPDRYMDLLERWRHQTSGMNQAVTFAFVAVFAVGVVILGRLP